IKSLALSLLDSLPISADVVLDLDGVEAVAAAGWAQPVGGQRRRDLRVGQALAGQVPDPFDQLGEVGQLVDAGDRPGPGRPGPDRSEEHTSELQSPYDL